MMRPVALIVLALICNLPFVQAQIEIRNIPYHEGHRSWKTDMAIEGNGVWYTDAGGVSFWDGATVTYYNRASGLGLDSAIAISSGLKGEIFCMAREGHSTKTINGWIVDYLEPEEYYFQFPFIKRIDNELWVSPSYPLYKLTLNQEGGYDTLTFTPPYEYFTDIEKDSQGNYYLLSGGWSTMGTLFLKQGAGDFEMARQDVTSIHVDTNDNLWAGTFGKVHVKSLGSEEYTTLTNDVISEFAFVSAIDSDPHGRIFLATSEGLVMIDGDTWTLFDESIGMLATETYDVRVSDDGIVWVMTQAGISRIALNPDNSTHEINGIVFHDLNGDAIKNGGEPGVKGQFVQVGQNAYVMTDSNGEFSFYPMDGTNTVKYFKKSFWNIADEFNEISFDYPQTSNPFLQFPLSWQIIEDVATDVIGTATRPGFDTQYTLSYHNAGSVTVETTLRFEFDERLDFIESTVPPDREFDSKLEWDISDLMYMAQRNIVLTFKVPQTTSLGTRLKNIASIEELENEINLENNADTLHQIVTGSFDPNDKLVKEGVLEDNFVLHNTPLTYTIRFQNTGTDTAFTVKIKDVIHSSLDLVTLDVLAASHSYETLIDGREITFMFDNIRLPDSTRNEPKSHGFVRYRIHPSTGLAENSVVTNEAAIFFDFNDPVATNVVSNKYVSEIPVGRITSVAGRAKEKIIVYPNPSNRSFQIKGHETYRFERFEILSTQGKSIKRGTFQSIIDTDQLPDGIYILRLYAGAKVVSHKIAITH